MLKIIKDCCGWLSGKLSIIDYLTAENLALRQQLIVLKRNQHRPAAQLRTQSPRTRHDYSRTSVVPENPSLLPSKDLRRLCFLLFDKKAICGYIGLKI